MFNFEKEAGLSYFAWIYFHRKAKTDICSKAFPTSIFHSYSDFSRGSTFAEISLSTFRVYLISRF